MYEQFWRPQVIRDPMTSTMHLFSQEVRGAYFLVRLTLFQSWPECPLTPMASSLRALFLLGYRYGAVNIVRNLQISTYPLYSQPPQSKNFSTHVQRTRKTGASYTSARSPFCQHRNHAVIRSAAFLLSPPTLTLSSPHCILLDTRPFARANDMRSHALTPPIYARHLETPCQRRYGTF